MFVEPIEAYFKELQENYKDHSGKFTFENVAITQEDGNVAMFMINEEYAHTVIKEHGIKANWIRKLASLDRTHLEKHTEFDIHQNIDETIVKGVKLKKLLRDHQTPRVDLLFVDTEGFDLEVLRTFPFLVYQPKAIMWEHRHLLTHQKSRAEELILQNNYQLRVFEFDTVAILRDSESEPIE